MFFSFLSHLTTLSAALLALGLAAFVLCCNRRNSANHWFALGLCVIAGHQALAWTSNTVRLELWQLTLLRAAFGLAATIPITWLGFSLTFAERDGGLRASRSFTLLWPMALLAFGTSIPLVFGRGIHLVPIANDHHTLVSLDWWGVFLFSTYLLGLVLVLLNLEALYRCAASSLRHRVRLLVLGLFVALGCQIAAASYTVLFRTIHPSHSFVSSAGFLCGALLMAFAVVRHGLLDSNIYVSRFVLYRSLTLSLVGAYLLALGVLAETLQFFRISLDFLTGAFVAIIGGGALAFLFLSEKVRWKAKSFIQAHFYRHKYDYREEWMGLTRHLSHATTASAVAMRTVERILNIMWVRQAAVYAIGDTPNTMHLVHQVGYNGLPATLKLSPTTVQILSGLEQQLPSTGRMEVCGGQPSEPIRGLFPETPIGHAVPLVVLDAPMGLLIVGPEVSGKPFAVDDRDLLAAVAAQAGAMIVNAQLAQQAADGRELHALARLSAFVAHDLKNAVGMLSLLAENAPNHLHQPAFQADAVRTLRDVTGRIQRLLTALRASNKQPGRKTTQTTLTANVETALRDIKSQIPPRIAFETRLEPTPEVAIDTDQFHTVLLNLLLNAVDAIPCEGRITVETGTDDGSAVLMVTDTGGGMSTDFMRDRLFRPFQTTKPRGLGIGLYQCRSIVQAFGGELTAESQEGAGTRMTVKIPALKDSNQLAGG